MSTTSHSISGGSSYNNKVKYLQQLAHQPGQSCMWLPLFGPEITWRKQLAWVASQDKSIKEKVFMSFKRQCSAHTTITADEVFCFIWNSCFVYSVVKHIWLHLREDGYAKSKNKRTKLQSVSNVIKPKILLCTSKWVIHLGHLHFLLLYFPNQCLALAVFHWPRTSGNLVWASNIWEPPQGYM